MHVTTVPPRRAGREQAFNLTELAVVLALLVLLICMTLPALAAGRDRSRVVQCAANLRQISLALHIYGNEYGDKMPPNGPGVWIWDLAWSAGSFIERTGCKWTAMYCPGTNVRFTGQDNLALYNFNPGAFHVIGYAVTLPGTASLNSTNQNTSLTPQSVTSATPPPPAAQRVFLADATISASGQNNEAARYTYNYTNITGGYPKSHLSAHLNGNIPAGGNLAMLDGHVEWRKFPEMHVRTIGSSPVFWW